MRASKISAKRIFQLLTCVIAATALMTVCGMLYACANSPAKDSASSIAMKDALGDTYQKALESVQTKAPDAKLLAIRSSSYSDENSASEWMYLFYSFDRAYAYTVFATDGDTTVADSGPMSISADDFEAIPDASTITVDAPNAWNCVTDSIDGDGRVYTARAFLMTYVDGDDDPTRDAMKWFFSINQADNLSSFFEKSDENSNNAAPARLFSVDCMNSSVSELDAESLDTE